LPTARDHALGLVADLEPAGDGYALVLKADRFAHAVVIDAEGFVAEDNYLHLTAPGIVTLSRKGDHLAVANKDGYEPTSLNIDRTWSWWVIGDIFGCLIIFSPLCIMHDIDQGGYYTFDDKIHLTLHRHTASEPAPSK